MLIAAIDTSGRQGSVALLRAAADGPVLLETAAIEGGQYSERLVPTLAELLVRHGAERSALELIAVASGPGSFTGLRIAMATVKGLAEAFATPVVAVSVLEAVVLAGGAKGAVVAALDAQRSEVFFGEYEVAGTRAEMKREGISGFEAFVAMAAGRQVFTPDEGLAGRLREAGVAVETLARPDAESYGRIAHRKFSRGEWADVATLDANYLRRSDAEIFVAPKPGVASRG